MSGVLVTGTLDEMSSGPPLLVLRPERMLMKNLSRLVLPTELEQGAEDNSTVTCRSPRNGIRTPMCRGTWAARSPRWAAIGTSTSRGTVKSRA